MIFNLCYNGGHTLEKGSFVFTPAYRDVKPSGNYVYLHLRYTDGSVFYVGKGSLRRAWNKTSGRSTHWKNVANKNGVLVHIVPENLTHEQAEKLEIDVISKHENLVNFTTGGEGKPGIPSSENQKASARTARSVPVINSEGEIFESATVAAKTLTALGVITHRAGISNSCMTGKNYKGLAWKKYRPGCAVPESKDYRSKMINHFGKKVGCSNGKVFESLTKATDWLKENGHEKAASSAISLACRGKMQQAYGFKWNYLQSDNS